eukprot:755804-Hanusia_phi.AAC.2
MAFQLRPIPISAWEKLYGKYKGGPVLNRIEVRQKERVCDRDDECFQKCTQCMKAEYELMQRRDHEQRLVLSSC